jgi:hypothetical protein
VYSNRDRRSRGFDPQAVEAYLKGNSRPRYMLRLLEIEGEFRSQLRLLEVAYRELEDACGDDVDRFSRAWRAEAHAWSFGRLNELIHAHNAWYPAEANLAMDPWTQDYVPIRGASYRRVELGADWILEHFPPEPRRGAPRPRVPSRAPREPAPVVAARPAGRARRR